jgi:hypothetical protein
VSGDSVTGSAAAEEEDHDAAAEEEDDDAAAEDERVADSAEAADCTDAGGQTLAASVLATELLSMACRLEALAAPFARLSLSRASRACCLRLLGSPPACFGQTTRAVGG